ncbi:5-formyltetrahydrofolate cyclo-ligase [Anaerocolumna cellulosilytica]|uniref:5-formyltetrahydrofolate cyclo-ligase n=1 Tax=Anaerocolumna cellulosilytica TaxID=433286 RepID=A0A6S6QVS2_9FIRM|nr:5-formyltetrahydrofolate cyclo-ligase [Anaerocolumna cellulosilytica]MBB5197130.1 5-formyltetrahydrofolate cyclo-ligase [Anaerocolumna cellulosilytica]BCJ95343.1 5-formyltetrahydrofolate cyclo-ligase [Anaerocolumna cellulosilytica]
MTKQQIRLHIKDLKEGLTLSDIENYSQQMSSVFLDSIEYKQSSRLFCYASFNQEVRTFPIIKKALADRKSVAVPKVLGDVIRFFEIHSLEELYPGKLGIPEPDKQPEAYPEAKKDNVILVPGLAFDKKGNRIGYGKGYYDKYFAEYEEVNWIKIALAYDFQVMNRVPSEERDKKINRIITQTKVIEIL